MGVMETQLLCLWNLMMSAVVFLCVFYDPVEPVPSPSSTPAGGAVAIQVLPTQRFFWWRQDQGQAALQERREPADRDEGKCFEPLLNQHSSTCLCP